MEIEYLEEEYQNLPQILNSDLQKPSIEAYKQKLPKNNIRFIKGRDDFQRFSEGIKKEEMTTFNDNKIILRNSEPGDSTSQKDNLRNTNTFIAHHSVASSSQIIQRVDSGAKVISCKTIDTSAIRNRNFPFKSTVPESSAHGKSKQNLIQVTKNCKYQSVRRKPYKLTIAYTPLNLNRSLDSSLNRIVATHKPNSVLGFRQTPVVCGIPNIFANFNEKILKYKKANPELFPPREAKPQKPKLDFVAVKSSTFYPKMSRSNSNWETKSGGSWKQRSNERLSKFSKFASKSMPSLAIENESEICTDAMVEETVEEEIHAADCTINSANDEILDSEIVDNDQFIADNEIVNNNEILDNSEIGDNNEIADNNEIVDNSEIDVNNQIVHIHEVVEEEIINENQSDKDSFDGLVESLNEYIDDETTIINESNKNNAVYTAEVIEETIKLDNVEQNSQITNLNVSKDNIAVEKVANVSNMKSSTQYDSKMPDNLINDVSTQLKDATLYDTNSFQGSDDNKNEAQDIDTPQPINKNHSNNNSPLAKNRKVNESNTPTTKDVQHSEESETSTLLEVKKIQKVDENINSGEYIDEGLANENTEEHTMDNMIIGTEIVISSASSDGKYNVESNENVNCTESCAEDMVGETSNADIVKDVVIEETVTTENQNQVEFDINQNPGSEEIIHTDAETATISEEKFLGFTSPSKICDPNSDAKGIEVEQKPEVIKEIETNNVSDEKSNKESKDMSLSEIETDKLTSLQVIVNEKLEGENNKEIIASNIHHSNVIIPGKQTQQSSIEDETVEGELSEQLKKQKKHKKKKAFREKHKNESQKSQDRDHATTGEVLDDTAANTKLAVSESELCVNENINKELKKNEAENISELDLNQAAMFEAQKNNSNNEEKTELNKESNISSNLRNNSKEENANEKDGETENVTMLSENGDPKSREVTPQNIKESESRANDDSENSYNISDSTNKNIVASETELKKDKVEDDVEDIDNIWEEIDRVIECIHSDENILDDNIQTETCNDNAQINLESNILTENLTNRSTNLETENVVILKKIQKEYDSSSNEPELKGFLKTSSTIKHGESEDESLLKNVEEKQVHFDKDMKNKPEKHKSNADQNTESSNSQKSSCEVVNTDKYFIKNWQMKNKFIIRPSKVVLIRTESRERLQAKVSKNSKESDGTSRNQINVSLSKDTPKQANNIQEKNDNQVFLLNKNVDEKNLRNKQVKGKIDKKDEKDSLDVEHEHGNSNSSYSNSEQAIKIPINSENKLNSEYTINLKTSSADSTLKLKRNRSKRGPQKTEVQNEINSATDITENVAKSSEISPKTKTSNVLSSPISEIKGICREMGTDVNDKKKEVTKKRVSFKDVPLEIDENSKQKVANANKKESEVSKKEFLRGKGKTNATLQNNENLNNQADKMLKKIDKRTNAWKKRAIHKEVEITLGGDNENLNNHTQTVIKDITTENFSNTNNLLKDVSPKKIEIDAVTDSDNISNNNKNKEIVTETGNPKSVSNVDTCKEDSSPPKTKIDENLNGNYSLDDQNKVKHVNKIDKRTISWKTRGSLKEGLPLTKDGDSNSDNNTDKKFGNECKQTAVSNVIEPLTENSTPTTETEVNKNNTLVNQINGKNSKITNKRTTELETEVVDKEIKNLPCSSQEVVSDNASLLDKVENDENKEKISSKNENEILVSKNSLTENLPQDTEITTNENDSIEIREKANVREKPAVMKPKKLLNEILPQSDELDNQSPSNKTQNNQTPEKTHNGNDSSESLNNQNDDITLNKPEKKTSQTKEVLPSKILTNDVPKQEESSCSKNKDKILDDCLQEKRISISNQKASVKEFPSQNDDITTAAKKTKINPNKSKTLTERSKKISRSNADASPENVFKTESSKSSSEELILSKNEKNISASESKEILDKNEAVSIPGNVTLDSNKSPYQANGQVSKEHEENISVSKNKKQIKSNKIEEPTKIQIHEEKKLDSKEKLEKNEQKTNRKSVDSQNEINNPKNKVAVKDSNSELTQNVNDESNTLIPESVDKNESISYSAQIKKTRSENKLESVVTQKAGNVEIKKKNLHTTDENSKAKENCDSPENDSSHINNISNIEEVNEKPENKLTNQLPIKEISKPSKEVLPTQKQQKETVKKLDNLSEEISRTTSVNQRKSEKSTENLLQSPLSVKTYSTRSSTIPQDLKETKGNSLISSSKNKYQSIASNNIPSENEQKSLTTQNTFLIQKLESNEKNSPKITTRSTRNSAHVSHTDKNIDSTTDSEVERIMSKHTDSVSPQLTTNITPKELRSKRKRSWQHHQSDSIETKRVTTNQKPQELRSPSLNSDRSEGSITPKIQRHMYIRTRRQRNSSTNEKHIDDSTVSKLSIDVKKVKNTSEKTPKRLERPTSPVAQILVEQSNKNINEEISQVLNISENEMMSADVSIATLTSENVDSVSSVVESGDESYDLNNKQTDLSNIEGEKTNTTEIEATRTEDVNENEDGEIIKPNVFSSECTETKTTTKTRPKRNRRHFTQRKKNKSKPMLNKMTEANTELKNLRSIPNSNNVDAQYPQKTNAENKDRPKSIVENKNIPNPEVANKNVEELTVENKNMPTSMGENKNQSTPELSPPSTITSNEPTFKTPLTLPKRSSKRINHEFKMLQSELNDKMLIPKSAKRTERRKFSISSNQNPLNNKISKGSKDSKIASPQKIIRRRQSNLIQISRKEYEKAVMENRLRKREQEVKQVKESPTKKVKMQIKPVKIQLRRFSKTLLHELVGKQPAICLQINQTEFENSKLGNDLQSKKELVANTTNVKNVISAPEIKTNSRMNIQSERINLRSVSSETSDSEKLNLNSSNDKRRSRVRKREEIKIKPIESPPRHFLRFGRAKSTPREIPSMSNRTEKLPELKNEIGTRSKRSGAVSVLPLNDLDDRTVSRDSYTDERRRMTRARSVPRNTSKWQEDQEDRKSLPKSSNVSKKVNSEKLCESQETPVLTEENRNSRQSRARHRNHGSALIIEKRITRSHSKESESSASSISNRSITQRKRFDSSKITDQLDISDHNQLVASSPKTVSNEELPKDVNESAKTIQKQPEKTVSNQTKSQDTQLVDETNSVESNEKNTIAERSNESANIIEKAVEANQIAESDLVSASQPIVVSNETISISTTLSNPTTEQCSKQIKNVHNISTLPSGATSTTSATSPQVRYLPEQIVVETVFMTREEYDRKNLKRTLAATAQNQQPQSSGLQTQSAQQVSRSNSNSSKSHIGPQLQSPNMPTKITKTQVLPPPTAGVVPVGEKSASISSSSSSSLPVPSTLPISSPLPSRMPNSSKHQPDVDSIILKISEILETQIKTESRMHLTEREEIQRRIQRLQNITALKINAETAMQVFIFLQQFFFNVPPPDQIATGLFAKQHQPLLQSVLQQQHHYFQPPPPPNIIQQQISNSSALLQPTSITNQQLQNQISLTSSSNEVEKCFSFKKIRLQKQPDADKTSQNQTKTNQKSKGGNNDTLGSGSGVGTKTNKRSSPTGRNMSPPPTKVAKTTEKSQSSPILTRVNLIIPDILVENGQDGSTNTAPVIKVEATDDTNTV